jgi:putative GTP pyrophosphokinase
MNTIPYPDRNKLRKIFQKHAESRERITKDLEARIEEKVRQLPSHLTVKGRAKDFASYFRKYVRVLKNSAGNSAAPAITDLIGIRIICPFIEDLFTVEALIKEHFDVFEVERKGSNHTFREFGYQSIHLLITIPQEIIAEWGEVDCNVAEIQIRTILQDAWAEVEHELVYKAEFTPFDEPLKRKLAAVNASLSLADIIFQEIKAYQRQLNGELGKRRDSFFKKIEESTDALLFKEDRPADSAPESGGSSPGSTTIDDLLLNALYAHNKNQFSQAISFYSRILEMNPDDSVAALIYKHRGMANFAQSQYQDAIDDFSYSLELDPGSYKAAYYRGIVKAVQSRYADAVDDFTLSLDIHPYQPFCLYRRGQAYYHLEDYPQALSDCEAALALDPESDSARKFRELLLTKLRM